MKNLNKLKEQYEKLGQEIKKLEDTPSYVDYTFIVPEDSDLFKDFRRGYYCSYSVRSVKFRLYETTEKTYNHQEALDKFEGINGKRLLTKEEIHFLISVGVLKRGDSSFWSSSVVSNGHNGAWQFYGYDGFVDGNVRNLTYGVRLIGAVE